MSAMIPPSSRRRRLSPEERRAELLDTAMDVFATMGIERAGHADVARQASVSTATVFNYFPSRPALVTAVLDEIEATVDAMFDGLPALSDDPERRVLQLAQAYQDMLEARPSAVKTFLKWGVSFDPDIRPQYLEYQGRILARLAEHLPHSDDTTTEARVLFGAANMLATMAFDGAPMEALLTYARRIAQVLAKPGGAA